jgi:IS605 OrfB family transposase
MKLIRSSKCSLKFATKYKLDELKTILTEYGKVCNIFIDYFWKNGTPLKSDLLKDIVDIPKDTWMSARLRKVAAREAIDMITATKERWKNKPNKMVMPVHKGKRMYVSCTIAELQNKETKEFDAWLHVASVGDDYIFDLPIKFHKHFNKLACQGKRLNSYIITEKYVQFSFEIETGKKKTGINAIGIDTGIKALASINNGTQFGLDTESLIERIKRCEHGSNGQKQARRAFKQRINEVVQEIVKEFKHIDLVVVERLKNMNYKSKLKRRLSKNMRRSIGTWAYRYWLMRLEQACETNRVSFRSVAPFYTSQTCPSCGHVDRGNRVGQVFQCLKCGHTGNADIIAAGNILTRFLTGLYGARYKPYTMNFNFS